jgi:hypothetical protein
MVAKFPSQEVMRAPWALPLLPRKPVMGQRLIGLRFHFDRPYFSGGNKISTLDFLVSFF